jgi:hypothetical protein
VATKQVNIDILAKDKTRMAMQSATKGVDKLKGAVFNLRNAFLGLGAGLVAKSFLDTAKEIENLRVRFRFLFKDAQEGEKAFKGLVKFAGDVPFALAEIQRGAGNLAVVSKNAQELNELLAITGDIATVAGLDFQSTAEQLQRVFSGGIAAADRFRDLGVRDMLGFQAGVQYSAEQSREHILRAFRDGTTNVKGASSVMATTFSGVMSMIGDKFLQFKIAVMDSAPFDFIKAGAMLLEKELSKNFGSIEKFGEEMGKALVEAFKSVLMFGAKTLDFFEPFFKFMKKSIINLIEFAQGIPAPFDTLGVIGFLMLGGKGKALIFIIGGFIDTIRSGLASIIDGIADVQESLNKIKWGRSEEKIKAVDDQVKEMRKSVERLKTPLADVDDKFGDINEKNTFEKLKKSTDIAFQSGTKYQDLLKGIFQDTEALIHQNKQVKEIKPPQLTGTETGIKGQDILQQGMGGQELLDAEMTAKAGIIDMAYTELAVAQQMAEEREKKLESLNKENSAIENLKSRYSEFFESFNAGKEVGNALFDSMMGVTRAIGDAVSQALVFGKSFKDAFGNAARQVVGQLVSALVQIGVKMLINATIGKALQASSTASSVIMANTIAGAYATPAALVSLATAGTNAIPAMAGIGSTVLLSNALASLGISGRKLGGRMNQDQPYLVGEAGPELVVPDRASNVVPNGQLGGMGKQVNVNFNITTVDATGFSELLVNSRATIVNVINQALNEKGKEVLV